MTALRLQGRGIFHRQFGMGLREAVSPWKSEAIF